MAEYGYPTRDHMDSLLDAYIQALLERDDARYRLEFLLLTLETDEGTYTFPDGILMNAGIKVTT